MDSAHHGLTMIQGNSSQELSSVTIERSLHDGIQLTHKTNHALLLQNISVYGFIYFYTLDIVIYYSLHTLYGLCIDYRSPEMEGNCQMLIVEAYTFTGAPIHMAVFFTFSL